MVLPGQRSGRSTTLLDSATFPSNRLIDLDSIAYLGLYIEAPRGARGVVYFGEIFLPLEVQGIEEAPYEKPN